MKTLLITVLLIVLTTPFYGQTKPTVPYNVNKMLLREKKVKKEEIIIPDVNGYKVLKCDFHIHTVFSDGIVWPTYRVEEAVMDDLDAIALTEHIEWGSHTKYIDIQDKNAPYEIALPSAKKSDLILIRAVEITRSQEPIGHYNALFVKDGNTINDKDPEKAIQNALDQDAFIIFNHPGWAQDSCYLSDFKQKMMDKKMFHGIEIFNDYEFYPRAVSWCVDKDYAMIGNTDIHGVVSEHYETYGDDTPFRHYRPMTLVFSKDRTEKGIQEALFAGRTVAYSYNTFAGKEGLLIDFFNACVEVNKKEVINKSSFPFVIKLSNGKEVDIAPMSTTKVKKGTDEMTVLNMWCYEDKHPVIKKFV